MYFDTGSDGKSRPSSYSESAATVTIGLVMDAIRKIESGSHRRAGSLVAKANRLHQRNAAFADDDDDGARNPSALNVGAEYLPDALQPFGREPDLLGLRRRQIARRQRVRSRGGRAAAQGRWNGASYGTSMFRISASAQPQLGVACFAPLPCPRYSAVNRPSRDFSRRRAITRPSEDRARRTPSPIHNRYQRRTFRSSASFEADCLPTCSAEPDQ